MLETRTGAGVVLLLSEGSELRFGQNTKIEVTDLTERPETRARVSRISLLYGKLRAFLSPNHQQEDSSFTVETPNAMAGVKFSQPVIEASYDPITRTSVFKAYTVVLEVTNRITREVRQVPRGNQVVIREESLQLSPLPSTVVPTPEEPFQEDTEQVPETQSQEAPPPTQDAEPATQEDFVPSPETQQEALPATSQAPTRASILRQARSAVRGTTSTTVPISVGAVGTGNTESTTETGGTTSQGGTTTTETSTNPSPGSRPTTTIRPRPVTITINED